MTVMTTMLRRHGATMFERNGREVAAHFGSPASEAAICRSGVGLADRSDRATLELRGDPAAVDEALAELSPLDDVAWWVRRTPNRAIVRCEGDAVGGCTSAMLRAEEVAVADISDEIAAVDLLGPRAEEVLEAHLARDESPVVLVVRRGGACVELLIPRAHGPALWNGLLAEGEPYGIACVGLEALEHLEVADRLVRRRSSMGLGGA